jgi:hypothetical protein
MVLQNRQNKRDRAGKETSISDSLKDFWVATKKSTPHVIEEGIPGYMNYIWRSTVGSPTMRDMYKNPKAKGDMLRAALGLATVGGLGYGGYKLYDWLKPEEEEDENTKRAEDLMPGGLADDKTNEDFNRKSLIQGRNVEIEHTGDPDIAAEIARDHLTEDPDYYDKLEDMEKGAEWLETLYPVPFSKDARFGRMFSRARAAAGPAAARTGAQIRQGAGAVGRGLGAAGRWMGDKLIDTKAREHFRLQKRMGEMTGQKPSGKAMSWLKETAGRAPTERMRPLDWLRALGAPRIPVKGGAPSLQKLPSEMSAKDKIMAGAGTLFRGGRGLATGGSALGVAQGLSHVYPSEYVNQFQATVNDAAGPGTMTAQDAEQMKKNVTGWNAPGFYWDMAQSLGADKEKDPLGYAQGQLIRNQGLSLFQDDVSTRVNQNPAVVAAADAIRSTSPMGMGVTGLERLLAHGDPFGKPRITDETREVLKEVIPRLRDNPELIENSPTFKAHKNIIPGDKEDGVIPRAIINLAKQHLPDENSLDQVRAVVDELKEKGPTQFLKDRPWIPAADKYLPYTSPEAAKKYYGIDSDRPIHQQLIDRIFPGEEQEDARRQEAIERARLSQEAHDRIGQLVPYAATR